MKLTGKYTITIDLIYDEETGELSCSAAELPTATAEQKAALIAAAKSILDQEIEYAFSDPTSC